MFSDYSASELGAIFAMQGFSGLSLFCVFLLMALGLAIIFGQMGVINMAHGEFLTIGAYTTYFISTLTEKYIPGFMDYYFFLAIIMSFMFAFIIGYLVEIGMVRHLYKRPLDTLLATWGLSLIMQQIFRSTFGAREVSPTLPDWLLGSYQLSEIIEIPINGMLVVSVTLFMTLIVFYMLFKSRWGLRVRATTQNRVMSGAAGINTNKVDRYTFAFWMRNCWNCWSGIHNNCFNWSYKWFALHCGYFFSCSIWRNRKFIRNDSFRILYCTGSIHNGILLEWINGESAKLY